MKNLKVTNEFGRSSARKKRWRLSFYFLLVVVLLCTNFVAQSNNDDSRPVQRQGEGQSRPAVEQKISPREAEELFRSVDEILKIVSDDSGLPIKKPMKRRLTSRDEVVAYVSKHMSEDEDA